MLGIKIYMAASDEASAVPQIWQLAEAIFLGRPDWKCWVTTSLTRNGPPGYEERRPQVADKDGPGYVS